MCVTIPKPPTPIIQVIVAMASQYRLEEVSKADLNIVHHTLVPTNEVLTPDEKKLLMEK
jgi:hypothetical protein